MELSNPKKRAVAIVLTDTELAALAPAAKRPKLAPAATATTTTDYDPDLHDHSGRVVYHYNGRRKPHAFFKHVFNSAEKGKAFYNWLWSLDSGTKNLVFRCMMDEASYPTLALPRVLAYWKSRPHSSLLPGIYQAIEKIIENKDGFYGALYQAPLPPPHVNYFSWQVFTQPKRTTRTTPPPPPKFDVDFVDQMRLHPVHRLCQDGTYQVVMESLPFRVHFS